MENIIRKVFCKNILTIVSNYNKKLAHFNSNIKFISSFASRHIGQVISLFIIGFTSSFLAIIIPVSIGKYYDVLFGSGSARSKILNYLPKEWTDTPSSFIIFFGVILLIRFTAYLYFSIHLKTLTELFIKEVKDKIFNFQFRVDQKIYEDKGIHKFLLRYSGDMSSIKNLLNNGTLSFFIDSIIVVIAMIWLITINLKGGIIVVVSVLIIYTLVYFINQKIEYYSKQKRNYTSGQLSFVTRSFNAMLSVVAFNRSYQEKRKFYKRTENIFQIGSKFILWDSINKALIYLMQYGVLLVVFIVFYIDSSTAIPNHTGGDLISFILLYVTILPVFGRIFKIETLWRLGLISIRKINHILSLPVTKRYEGEELITKNPRLTIIDFSVKGSNTIAYNSSKGGVRNLKLPSNLSAMDLFKCLLRINDDYSGAIQINQTSIKEFTAKSVRYNISIISTQFNFIGRTVIDAIATNKNLATIEKATDLIHDIQIKFAITSPLLINDYIGENGNQLNPLQKEVLSIARALMTDAKIIVVDTLPHLIKYNSTAYKEFWSQLDKSIVSISYESESQIN